MNIILPWAPLIVLLMVSFFALYGGVLLCHAEKPKVYKVGLAAIIPWISAIVVIWIADMLPPYQEGGVFWLWTAGLTILGYLVLQLFLIWKLIGLKPVRAFLAFLGWIGLMIICAGLTILFVRFSEN